METDKRPPERPSRGVPRGQALEWVAAAVLALVLLALGWVAVAAYRPEWGGWVAMEIQVGVVLGLLTAALVLVSAVALRHTSA